MTSKDPTHPRLEKTVEATGGANCYEEMRSPRSFKLFWILRPRRLTHKITLAEIRPIRQQYYQEDDKMGGSLVHDIKL